MSRHPDDYWRLQFCPHCSYDLRQLPHDHQCPECGYPYSSELLAVNVWQTAEVPSPTMPLIYGSAAIVSVAVGMRHGFLSLWGIMAPAMCLACWGAIKRFRHSMAGGTDSILLADSENLRLLNPDREVFVVKWDQLKTIEISRRRKDYWRLQAARSAWTKFFVADIDVCFHCSSRHAAVLRSALRQRATQAALK